MTYAEYDAIEAIRCSDLKLIGQSPAHYKANKINPRPTTQAMLFGSLVHALTLEPDKWREEFIVSPIVDRRTKAGKEKWAEFEEQVGNRTVIESKTLDAADEVSSHILKHPICWALLQGGESEKVIQWEMNCVPCKARLDLYRPGWIVDIKTIASAEYTSFMRSCWNYKYHMQAAWYIDGVKAAGLGECNFVFIAVEKEPPYAVACYTPDTDMIAVGREEYLANMNTYLECVENDNWPGIGWDYGEGRYEIQSICLPPWAF